ncbi:hypothetical protein [Micromonospora sp. NBC_01796]|nr:hypothetical protein [Micromonospora sp. NBC_01796]WSA87901.1 hypothetical protein OIE47_10005 [Micromonospora sp. NBC_01796]
MVQAERDWVKAFGEVAWQVVEVCERRPQSLNCGCCTWARLTVAAQMTYG